MRSNSKSVLIVFNTPRESGPGTPWYESEAGVLEEVKAVSKALQTLGVRFRAEGLRTLSDLPPALEAGSENIVFNLVEGFQEEPQDACYVPSLCRAYGKACTGSDTSSLIMSSDKWKTKGLLLTAGLPCPRGTLVLPGEPLKDLGLPPGPKIVKPVSSDGSEGISASSVVKGDDAALAEAVRLIHEKFGQPALVEQFVGDRELNAALLQRGHEVDILPISEIDFSTFGRDRPRIVDYAAKWVEASFEYNNTPRIIPSPLPGPQLEAVRRTALAAWHVLECSDYARVDLRLDENGQPVILEVNANPDISPGGGFEAALKAANVPYEHFVSIVLENADHRSRRLPANPPLPLTSPPPHPGLLLRRTEPRDREPILALLAATNFFRPNEIEIAKEVLDNALARGETGHYQSFAADEKGQAVGWVCFGPTPCAQGTFDIYWLAVAPRSQRLKIGSALINHAESLIRERGGRVIVVETSGRPEYDATRRFYKKIGYHQAARVRNFYAEGDDKLIYTKILSA